MLIDIVVEAEDGSLRTRSFVSQTMAMVLLGLLHSNEEWEVETKHDHFTIIIRPWREPHETKAA